MRLSYDAARDDIAQLVALLSESHPDPYTAPGGPLAFHRQAQDILAGLPAEGLSDVDFLRLVRPLVASVRDGHTRIGLDIPVPPDAKRLWLDWDVIEQELYVAAVYRPEDVPLLGARLRALDGVPCEELRVRMGHLQGFDNAYHDLLLLATALADPLLLPEVLSRAELPTALNVTVLLPNGALSVVTLPLLPLVPLVPRDDAVPGARITPPTAMPTTELTAAHIGWRFLDAQRHVAYLRADSLMHYREAFEYSAAVGATSHLDLHLAATARAATAGDLPDSITDRLALVPSATDLLRDLLTTMRDARSPYLLVDLRFCPGGNSLFALLLIYFLYGFEAAVALDEGYQVKRYSPLYLANRLSTRREDLALFFQNGGYDFTEEEQWRRRLQTGWTTEERERRAGELAAYAARMPSFGRVFAERQDEALWTPHVVVLTAARTYSAGFDVAAALAQFGADIVGVPSAQAANCFIDVLPYTLTHSSLHGLISHKWSQLFPDDPARGKVLWPTRELTYAYLAEQRFDPHASITLARDHLGR